MTDKELVKEFERWILAGRPRVWVKVDRDAEISKWDTIEVPFWNPSRTVYIVDDEQAEIRKHLVDNPNTKIQFRINSNRKWADIINPQFDIPNCEYRVKPKKIERRWRYAKDKDGCTITTSNYVTDNRAEDYGYLEEGWYKLENDYIDVKVEA